MNDINLYYDKKFVANYGYPMFIFKESVHVWTVTIFTTSVHVLNPKYVKIGCLLSLFY